MYWKLGTFLENPVSYSYIEAKHKGQVEVVVDEESETWSFHHSFASWNKTWHTIKTRSKKGDMGSKPGKRQMGEEPLFFFRPPRPGL